MDVAVRVSYAASGWKKNRGSERNLECISILNKPVKMLIKLITCTYNMIT